MALDVNMLNEHLSYLKKVYEDAVYNEKTEKELNRISEQIKLISELIQEIQLEK